MGNKEVFDSKGVISWPQVIFELFVKKSGIHFVYIIVILIAILIFMFTYNFAENKDLVAYLSFAATISSLILATFAIFYAVHSNSDISNLSSEIKNSSSVLKESSSNIAASSEKLNNITDEINLAMDGLSQKLDVMPKTIIDGVHDLKGRNVQFSSDINGANKNSGNAEILLDDDKVSLFIKNLAQTPKVYALFALLSWKSGVKIKSNAFQSIFFDDFIAMMSFCSVLNTLKVICSSITFDTNENDFVIDIISSNDICENAIFSEIEILFDKMLKMDNPETTYAYQAIIKCFQSFDHSYIPESCNAIAEIINRT